MVLSCRNIRPRALYSFIQNTGGFNVHFMHLGLTCQISFGFLL